MKLINVTNGGVVSVSEDQGKALLATGTWKEPGKATKRTTRKSAPKKEPEEEK